MSSQWLDDFAPCPLTYPGNVSEQGNRTNITLLHSLSVSLTLVFSLKHFNDLTKFLYLSDWVVEKCRKDPTIVTKLFHKSIQGNKTQIECKMEQECTVFDAFKRQTEMESALV